MTSHWSPADVLPHRGPSLLLTRIVSWSSDRIVGEVDVPGDGPYSDAVRGVPRWLALEYMAQAVGALDGIHLKESGLDVPPGYLLGTRTLDRIDGHFAPGSRLRITAQEILRDESGLGA